MILGDGNYQDLLDAAELAEIFPEIDGKYRITSPNCLSYNCLAWVVGVDKKWFDPTPNCVGYYWPSEIEREWSIPAIRKLLALYGFTEESSDSSFEPGYIKLACYVDDSGEPAHFAKQLETGKWTSKLADLNDVEHDTLECLEGEHYGSVKFLLKRKVNRSNK